MDKRKYETKTLIAEYIHSRDNKDFKVIEMIYRLKDGRIIMEYDGGRLSRYGVSISYNKRIGIKGICEVSEDDYETWKFIRSSDSTGSFINWEEEQMEQFEDWKNEMFKIYNNEHKKVLELINIDKLPF
ncbi:MAG: hypothetical protein ABF652_02600 [Clostridium beijerinckii]